MHEQLTNQKQPGLQGGPPGGKPVEVVLVEDNPDDATLALHALRSEPVSDRIEVLEDGEAALDALLGRGEYAGRELHPRLVLLDLKLPLVDGFEVLESIRANPNTSSVPVVVLTSSREERDVEHAYELGANSYVVKPVDFPQFDEAVRTVARYWLEINQDPASPPVR